MATSLEDLEVLQNAEGLADELWGLVLKWDGFARDVVGKQLATAADSVGANIAESFGRYHYGEKLNFLYYARGSVFETKYWLNRTRSRQLIAKTQVETYSQQLTTIARQLNAFARSLKSQRHNKKTLREPEANYTINAHLFTESDLTWLLNHHQPEPSQSPISSLQSPTSNPQSPKDDPHA